MGMGEAVAWGKVKQFLKVFSRTPDVWWDEDIPNDGWQYAAMHYNPHPVHGVYGGDIVMSDQVIPGNHP